MSKIKLTNNFKGIIDTTLRDGQQSPLLFDTYTYRFSLDDKLTLVKGLLESGVRMFEFFAPVVSDIERDDFASIQSYIRSKTDDVMLLAHCRCHPADIEQALDAGFDGINLYIGITEHAQKYSHGMNFSEIKDRVIPVIKEARKNNPDLYIRFSVEDAFRTDLTHIYELYDSIWEYVNTFGMPDTVGIATPTMVYDRVTALKKRYPTVDLECHFHNDRGYSLVNATTAVLAGASYIDTSIWGMAERSGITSFTGLLFNLFQEDRALCSKYKIELSYPLNVLMASILKYHVPYNEPISITNRTHTAGVHQNAMIHNKCMYEAVDLADFGVTKNQLLLGPLSGWNLIYYFLREFHFIDISKEQAREIAQEFKMSAHTIGRGKKPEAVLLELVRQKNYQKIPVQVRDLKKRIEHF
ncbi:pyruvate carboxyltransferase [Candidatus Roizmanbacteria bacterium CG_4_9_14_0_2_um_filter_39_13]|uniref:Pyruvate carboxyltransferase n=1 Tax=Candidatus Roizmanbacteria bacterium CG_4_9_14_0_2_um_filter_39_13 TaxID=1974839 RepID=A0A2M8EW64_9BACT|nr:MAG: pyruvate carboxyltransferase [Candidatus Roizmanbacteria bacterium CG_4_10_14_0_2_um_filter_39_12]PJC30110.1 MAG: pyruvate carboxyltransferase [Candidatus Roizmanbacteria bacterium CG_4_9_14_0_2_um_filter_39_13]